MTGDDGRRQGAHFAGPVGGAEDPGDQDGLNGRQTYAKGKKIVEPVFGQIKGVRAIPAARSVKDAWRTLWLRAC